MWAKMLLFGALKMDFRLSSDVQNFLKQSALPPL